MKKILLAIFGLCAAGVQAQAPADTEAGYELRVLTFEDTDYKGGTNFAGGTDWSSLIDDPQYGGPMLYGDGGMGVYSYEEAYKWTDEGNTMLSNHISGWDGTPPYCYWSGGEAISNYGSKNIEAFGNSTNQLTVYNPNGSEDESEPSRSGNGHNGSDNFAMHYGYTDNSGYSMGDLSELTFSDGVARVIDHVYVTNSTYAINCYVNGNSLTAKINEGDWVKLVFTGYCKGEETGVAEIYLVNGPDNIVFDWTKFDLSGLGAVDRVTINVTGSSDNGCGFSQPAYFAWDDMAVRFPSETGVEEIVAETAEAPVYYNLQGVPVVNPANGVFIECRGTSVRKVRL